jgi:hypothetical protein
VAITMAAPNADMAQFFDFSEAAIPDMQQESGHDVSVHTSERQVFRLVSV